MDRQKEGYKLRSELFLTVESRTHHWKGGLCHTLCQCRTGYRPGQPVNAFVFPVVPPLPFRVVSRSTSLRNKRFRLVLEQRKTEERDFRFWPREKWNESQKMKEGGGEGEGKERNACRQTPRFWKPTFASERSAWLARLVEQYWLPFSPPPARSFTCANFRVVFDSRSSFFAPKPPTETLAIRRLALYARSALPSLRLLAW